MIHRRSCAAGEAIIRDFLSRNRISNLRLLVNKFPQPQFDPQGRMTNFRLPTPAVLHYLSDYGDVGLKEFFILKFPSFLKTDPLLVLPSFLYIRSNVLITDELLHQIEGRIRWSYILVGSQSRGSLRERRGLLYPPSRRLSLTVSDEAF